MSASARTPGKGGTGAAPAKDGTAQAIAAIAQQRELRRRSALQKAAEKQDEIAKIEASGLPIFDADFQRMIMAFRATAEDPRPHASPGEHDICVVARKRPINKREIAARDWDAVTCLNPRVVVHAPKLKVDGITKILDNTQFELDHTFDDGATTADVYRYTVMPLVSYAFEKRGRGTCIAYGQTGSGKTHTISGLHQLVARDVFAALLSPAYRGRGLTVHLSFLEIYGARCSDLLHGRAKVTVREDARQRIVASGLEEEECDSAERLLELIEAGAAERATHATDMNAQSSRSHAICEVTLRAPDGRAHGSLSLVDLAGSERAADSRNHNRQRRLEGAEINKSLLALKECIRALAMRASSSSSAPGAAADAAHGGAGAGPHVHVPFRASKLTMVLRDSFTSSEARVCMIATVSPNAASADHTQNTLRYADRVKEKPLGGAAELAAGLLEPVADEDEDVGGAYTDGDYGDGEDAGGEAKYDDGGPPPRGAWPGGKDAAAVAVRAGAAIPARPAVPAPRAGGGIHRVAPVASRHRLSVEQSSKGDDEEVAAAREGAEYAADASPPAPSSRPVPSQRSIAAVVPAPKQGGRALADASVSAAALPGKGPGAAAAAQKALLSPPVVASAAVSRATKQQQQAAPPALSPRPCVSPVTIEEGAEAADAARLKPAAAPVAAAATAVASPVEDLLSPPRSYINNAHPGATSAAAAAAAVSGAPSRSGTARPSSGSAVSRALLAPGSAGVASAAAKPLPAPLKAALSSKNLAVLPATVAPESKEEGSAAAVVPAAAAADAAGGPSTRSSVRAGGGAPRPSAAAAQAAAAALPPPAPVAESVLATDPAPGIAQPAAAAPAPSGGWFRKLLKRGQSQAAVPAVDATAAAAALDPKSGPIAAPAAAVVAPAPTQAAVTASAAATSTADPSLRSKLRERGKLHRATNVGGTGAGKPAVTASTAPQTARAAVASAEDAESKEREEASRVTPPPAPVDTDSEADEPLEAVLDRGLVRVKPIPAISATAPSVSEQSAAATAAARAPRSAGGGGSSSTAAAATVAAAKRGAPPPTSGASTPISAPQPRADAAAARMRPSAGGSGKAAGAPAAAGGGAAASAPGKAAARGGGGGESAGSPQQSRDLALVHTLRRDELRSRGGAAAAEAGGGPGDAGHFPSAAAGLAAVTLQPTAAGGGELELPVEETALLQLHETTSAVLEQEEHLLNAHMHAIQENALQIQEEGRLLGSVQGADVVDYDIDEYSRRLEELLRAKVRTATGLLRRLAAFRGELAREELLSRRVNERDMQLA